MKSLNLHRSGMTVIMLLLFFHLNIMATQSASGGANCDSGLWSGEIKYQLSKDAALALIERLKDPNNIVKAPRDFFGDLYNSKLVDMVAFFGPDGSHNVALSEDCTDMKELFGERNVYLMLFAVVPESDITLVSAPPQKGARSDTAAPKVSGYSIDTMVVKPDAIKVSLTAKVTHSQLDFRHGAGDRSVRGIITALMGVFGFNPEAGDKGETVADYSLEIKDWRILYRGPLDGKDTLTFIYAYEKIPIHENTINGIAVRMPNRGADLYTRFGNYSSSYLGTSIGLMASASEQHSEYDPASPVDGRPSFRPFFTKMEAEPFFFIHLYMIRPRLPALDKNYFTVSAVAGSKIDFKNFPVDLFMGMAWGHLKGGSFHLLTGWNFARFTTSDGSFYKGEPMIGLSYGL